VLREIKEPGVLIEAAGFLLRILSSDVFVALRRLIANRLTANCLRAFKYAVRCGLAAAIPSVQD
jgi:hypothetical protein